MQELDRTPLARWREDGHNWEQLRPYGVHNFRIRHNLTQGFYRADYGDGYGEIVDGTYTQIFQGLRELCNFLDSIDTEEHFAARKAHRAAIAQRIQSNADQQD